MAPNIIHPDGGTREAVGLNFVDGVAEVETLEDSARKVLLANGYKVEESAPKPPTERELLVTEAKALGLDAKGKVDELKKRIADRKSKQQTPPASSEGNTSPATGGGAKDGGDS